MQTDRCKQKHYERAEEMSLICREKHRSGWFWTDQHGMGQLPNLDPNFGRRKHGHFLLQVSLMMGLMFHLTKARMERAGQNYPGSDCLSSTSSCWTAGQCCPEGFWPPGPFWSKRPVFCLSGLCMFLRDRASVPFPHLLATEMVWGRSVTPHLPSILSPGHSLDIGRTHLHFPLPSFFRGGR